MYLHKVYMTLKNVLSQRYFGGQNVSAPCIPIWIMVRDPGKGCGEESGKEDERREGICFELRLFKLKILASLSARSAYKHRNEETQQTLIEAEYESFCR